MRCGSRCAARGARPGKQLACSKQTGERERLPLSGGSSRAGRAGVHLSFAGALLSGFDDPGAALAAAVELQRAVARESWPFGVTLRLRIALHSGDLAPGAAARNGLDVYRVERIAALAHGGQVLLSHRARVRAARAG